MDGEKLLFDPFLSRNDKLYKPPIDELSGIMSIFVTHGHLDHIADIPAIWEHGRRMATIFCTAKPKETLMLKSVADKNIHMVAPGDTLSAKPFTVRVLRGKHIVFDKFLVLRKLLNPRVFIHWSSLRSLLKENKVCVEAGETVAYDIDAKNKRILLLGSMNLDDNTQYPIGVDLLILPFQGHSCISKYAIDIISRLKPKKVLLDHYDNTFPPISSAEKTDNFLSQMRRKYPDIAVIYQPPSAEWIEIE